MIFDLTAILPAYRKVSREEPDETTITYFARGCRVGSRYFMKVGEQTAFSPT